MARRRRREHERRAGELEVPDELRRCIVEDWVDENDAGDVAEIERRQRASATQDRDFIVRIVAWRRWQQAGRVWADEHELTREQHMGLLPSGRPRRREEHGLAESVLDVAAQGRRRQY